MYVLVTRSYWDSLASGVWDLYGERGVGKGEDLGFNSYSAPISPNCWPEVAIGGCKTQVSTTRGNEKWVQENNTQHYIYYLPLLRLLHEVISLI
jgi:hypothetical protein